MRILLASILFVLPASVGLGQGVGYYEPNWYHAATAHESVMRGAAAIIQSVGQGNLALSQAAQNLAQARQTELQTQIMLRQYRHQEFQARLNHQTDYEQWQAMRRANQEQAMRLSRQAAPERLREYEFDPATGQMAWPSLLQMPQFGPYRERIDRLMAKRASQGQLSGEEAVALDEAINGVRYLLRDEIVEYPPDLYVAARRFVNSLGYESTLATGGPRTQLGSRTAEPAGPAARTAQTSPTSRVW